MTSPIRKKKAISITLETKYEIIQSVQKGDSPKKDIASKFGIPSNALSTILKNKDLILALYENSTTSTSRQRNHPTSHVNVENALLGWFKEKQNQNIPLSGSIRVQHLFIIPGLFSLCSTNSL